MIARFLACIRCFAVALAALLSMSMDPSLALAPPDRMAILALLRAGDFAELERVFGQYHQAYDEGRTSDITLELAYNAFRSADPDLAPILDRWIEDNPASHVARLARGFYRYHLGWMARGAKTVANTPAAAMDGMREYFRLARRDLRAALDLKPNLGLAYSFLIGIAMASGPSETIDDLLRQALAADPGSFTVRSRYLHSIKPWWNGKRARRHYPVQHWLVAVWRIINGTIRRNEAYAREMTARMAEDIRGRLGEAPELAPLLGYGHYLKAEMLARKGRRDDAELLFQSALEAGDFVVYWNRRGINHRRAGRNEEAVASFDRALALRPDVPQILKGRALAHRKLKDYESALADLERALAFEPYHPDILADHAFVLDRLGRPDEALESLDKALVYGMNNGWVWYTRGQILLYSLKDPAGAVPHFKRATELEPRRALYWYYYGGALSGAKDCAAVEVLQQYRRMCRKGGKGCEADRRDWAEHTLHFVEQNKVCPS